MTLAFADGTRKPSDGDSTEDILKDFPTLTAIDVRAVIAFAAAAAEEDLPLQALPRAS
jgi:uncharacterized protein (DUF433 family)